MHLDSTEIVFNTEKSIKKPPVFIVEINEKEKEKKFLKKVRSILWCFSDHLVVSL